MATSKLSLKQFWGRGIQEWSWGFEEWDFQAWRCSKLTLLIWHTNWIAFGTTRLRVAGFRKILIQSMIVSSPNARISKAIRTRAKWHKQNGKTEKCHQWLIWMGFPSLRWVKPGTSGFERSISTRTLTVCRLSLLLCLRLPSDGLDFDLSWLHFWLSYVEEGGHVFGSKMGSYLD